MNDEINWNDVKREVIAGSIGLVAGGLMVWLVLIPPLSNCADVETDDPSWSADQFSYEAITKDGHEVYTHTVYSRTADYKKPMPAKHCIAQRINWYFEDWKAEDIKPSAAARQLVRKTIETSCPGITVAQFRVEEIASMPRKLMPSDEDTEE